MKLLWLRLRGEDVSVISFSSLRARKLQRKLISPPNDTAQIHVYTMHMCTTSYIRRDVWRIGVPIERITK